ncbi:MAG TPA: site-2 protease family protein [Terriglobales bacterium]|nr:site-2 protease family protein [Terriglobales bacterium]
MRSWSFPAGRVFGIDIRVHLTFAFLLMYVWMTEGSGLGAASLGRGFALVGLVLASVILHEMGHMLATIQQHVPARSVVLLPIGGVSLLQEPSRQKLEPNRELRISLAGPLVNLLLAFLAAAIVLSIAPEAALWKQPFVYSGNLPRSFFWINLFLGVFNLLPAYPADGGRMVRAILARRMDHVRATRRAVSIGQGFAMAFILAGIWNTWLMLVGFFLFVAAQLEDRSAVFQSVLEQVRLEDVMLTDFSTLSPADTLEGALHKAVHTLQDDFPVVRGSDMVGVISRQKILEAMRSSGNGYVQSVMNRVFSSSQANDTLASAFRKLTSQGVTVLPVVDSGRLVGIVTLQNLMHSMSLLAETKRLRHEQEQQH